MWATALPFDILLDIFRRLGSTAVIRCAGVCKAWRRAIIDNARCLQPRPDRFLPDLLVAFFNYNCHLQQHTMPENDVPSAENVLAMESVFDVGPHDLPLASRDGFVLLEVWDKALTKRSLCLCNLLAGSCRSLSIPAVGQSSGQCSYALVTAYDDDDSSLADDADGADGSAVRILAVTEDQNLVTYQMFSLTSGAWGPVKRSAKLIDGDLGKVCVGDGRSHAVVCGGSVVYWLVVLLSFVTDEDCECHSCLFAMDMRTERTWITELPEEFTNTDNQWDVLLATSEDGRQPSLVAAKSQGVRQQIEVWEFDGNSAWTLKRTMDMPDCPFPYLPSRDQIWLRCFCPRSGYLFLIAMDPSGGSGLRQQFLVGVDGSPSRQVGRLVKSESCFVLPYEMDWSTYISKMKYF